MVTTIRVLYVVILVLAWGVSIFLSFDEESLMIFLLVFWRDRFYYFGGSNSD